MSLLLKLAKKEKLVVFSVILFMTIGVVFTIVQSGLIANLMSFTFHLDTLQEKSQLQDGATAEKSLDLEQGASLQEKIFHVIKLATTQSNQKATEFIVASKDFALMITLGLIVFLSIMLTQFLIFVKDYSIHYLSIVFAARMRRDLFSTFVHLPVKEFSHQKSGDLVSRTLIDVERITLALREFLEGIVYGLFLAAVGFAVMFWLNQSLTFILLLIAFFLVGVIQITSGFLRKIVRRLQKKIADISQYIQESIQSINIIKVYARERWETRRFDTFIANHFSLSVKETLIFQLIRPITEVIGVLGIIFIFIYSSSLIWKKELSIEELVNFLIILVYIIPYLQRITKAFFVREQINASADRIEEILKLEKEHYRKNHGQKLTNYKGNFSFKNVDFTYAANTPLALKKINLEIKSGEMVAVVGPSGGGKTTLMSLIPQLLVPTGGKIFYNEVPHDEISLFELRRQIAFVTQENILFSSTLKENIRYGRIEASDHEVTVAAEKAHLGDLLKRLPKGLNSFIGERGASLSGGEKQRISLARAIIKNPPILLLDEATSALDSQSERIVSKAIEDISKERTTIVIAHRLQTVAKADRVIVLANGEIVEEGKHDSLLKKEKGIYRQLYESLLVKN